MRLLFYIFIVTPAVLILAAGGLIALALEPAPLVTQAPRLDARSADDAWRVLRRLVVTAAKATNDVTLVITKSELDGLLALGSRGLPGLRARSELNQDGAVAEATLELPSNPFGRYLNVKAGLLESQQGLALAPVSLGRLKIPGAVVETLSSFGLDVLLGAGSGSIVLGAIERTAVDRRQIALALNHDPEVLARLKSWDERLADVRDQVQPLGDPAIVRVYLGRLMELPRSSNGHAQLAQSLSSVFALARERSTGGDAVAENRAAILALAGFYGELGILRLVGPVVDDSTRGRLPRSRGVLVAGREDLPKHFLISAALQIVSTSGMSYAVGELKEFLDSDTGRGGSGFSFVDLAADRAGVRFAEVAVSRDTARSLQEKLAAGTAEAAFFPAISGLQEWMPQATFEQRFGGVNDNRYKAVVRDIDRRIEALPAYAG